MNRWIKGALSAAVAVLISIGVTTFTYWDFDPASWDALTRGSWSLITLVFAGFAFVIAAFPPETASASFIQVDDEFVPLTGSICEHGEDGLWGCHQCIIEYEKATRPDATVEDAE